MLKKYAKFKVLRFSFNLANMVLYTKILTHSHTQYQRCYIYINLGVELLTQKSYQVSFHLKIETQYNTSYFYIFHQKFNTYIKFSQGTKSYFLILVSSIKNDTQFW